MNRGIYFVVQTGICVPARKRNRKEVLPHYNKTRINIDHQHDRWMELKEALRVQTNAGVTS
jgi:hypothetical protein